MRSRETAVGQRSLLARSLRFHHSGASESPQTCFALGEVLSLTTDWPAQRLSFIQAHVCGFALCVLVSKTNLAVHEDKNRVPYVKVRSSRHVHVSALLTHRKLQYLVNLASST